MDDAVWWKQKSPASRGDPGVAVVLMFHQYHKLCLAFNHVLFLCCPLWRAHARSNPKSFL